MVNLIKNVKIKEENLITNQANCKNSIDNPSKENVYSVYLSSLVRGQSFGEVEVLKNTKRQCKAICDTNVTVYQVNSMIFLNIVKSNPSVQKKFENQCNLKEEWQKKQIDNFIHQRQYYRNQILQPD